MNEPKTPARVASSELVRRLRDNEQYVDACDEAADWIEAAAKVLQQVSDLLPGTLNGVGGGTLVAPTIKVQLVKDARELMPPNAALCRR